MFSVLPKGIYLLDNSVNTEAGLVLVTKGRTGYMDLNYFRGKEPK